MCETTGGYPPPGGYAAPAGYGAPAPYGQPGYGAPPAGKISWAYVVCVFSSKI